MVVREILLDQAVLTTTPFAQHVIIETVDDCVFSFSRTQF